ncbi:MAG: PEP-CTERM sorting domain-containing protein [Steroidobacteraceae bacterium]
MHRRRRTLVLLALIPASLAAGGMGYWWHASKAPAPRSEDPIALLLGAPTTDDVVLDQLINIPTSPSYEDIHHPAAASSELITLATDDGTPSPSEYPIGDVQQLDDAGFVAMAFDASAFGSSSGAAGYENTGRGIRSGSGAGGGGSGKSSNPSSENHQQSTSAPGQTNPAATDDPVALDDRVAANEQDGNPDGEPLVHLPPRDHAGSCYQLWCSNPRDSDRPESGSPHEHYSPVIPDPTLPNDETDAKPHVSVPEPGSLGLLSVGLSGLLASRRRRLARSKSVLDTGTYASRTNS